MITVDAQVLNLVIGVVLPLLVALVTKQRASSATKGKILALLAIVSATAVEVAQAGGSFILNDVLTAIAVQYVAAQTSYGAALKPLGLTRRVAEATADRGVGVPVTSGVQEAVTEGVPPLDTPPVVMTDEETFAFESLNSLLDEGDDVLTALRKTAAALEGEPLE